jgi:hypothetical protein
MWAFWQLLEHAASMLDTNVAPEDRADLVQRQTAVASMATAHAVLAAAAVIDLSPHLDIHVPEWSAAACSPGRQPSRDPVEAVG